MYPENHAAIFFEWTDDIRRLVENSKKVGPYHPETKH